MKDIRQSDAADENLLRRAYAVYQAHESFIERDRHDKFNDADRYAHKLVDSVNQFNGTDVCSAASLVSAWTFKAGNTEFKYTRGKYNAQRAVELYHTLASACINSDALLRVHRAFDHIDG